MSAGSWRPRTHSKGADSLNFLSAPPGGKGRLLSPEGWGSAASYRPVPIGEHQATGLLPSQGARPGRRSLCTDGGPTLDLRGPRLPAAGTWASSLWPWQLGSPLPTGSPQAAVPCPPAGTPCLLQALPGALSPSPLQDAPGAGPLPPGPGRPGRRPRPARSPPGPELPRRPAE